MGIVKTSAVVREVRSKDRHAMARLVSLQPCFRRVRYRFFNKNDLPRNPESGEQLLRPLIYKIPTEMAKDDEWCHGFYRGGNESGNRARRRRGQDVLPMSKAPRVRTAQMSGEIATTSARYIPEAAVVPVARVLPVRLLW